MNRIHSIELLNKAVGYELQSIHQYLYFHFHFEDKGYKMLSKMFERISIVEMKHLEMLADRILFLGGDVFESLYQNIFHLCDMGLENHIAIGSDFDGCEINSELSGVDKIPALREYLHEKGINNLILDKIFFENSNKFFKNILQNQNNVI